MNKLIVSIILLATLCSLAHAQEPTGMDRVRELDAALQKDGLSGLLVAAREHRWQAPRMPSRWSVGHRPGSDEQTRVDLAAREFGREMAVQLEAVATVLQELPPGDELHRQALLLCDLSDWCASTPGYGNLFLAQRCLDLAAVGLARLAASLDFPLAGCGKLAARMTPAWMGVEARALTLNDEAGTNLFAVDGTQADLEKTWGSGGFLMREKRSGRTRPEGQAPGRGFVETPALKANLDFFERDEPGTEPLTLVNSWDARRYERIVNGLELQNVYNALALLAFRKVVGCFPEKIAYTNDQLKEREKMRSLHEKLGIKVNISSNNHVSGKDAFLYAWDQRKDKDPKDHNLDARAWQAYSEVKSGQFLDQDTRAVRMALPATKVQ
ncbi:MAG: hypothetical protein ACOX5G_11730 [Kiritimatiellia bacterium]|jgi:hypothetical protein